MKRRFPIAISIVLCAMMQVAVSNAAVYYVSTADSANDSNAGTQSQPWRTITKAANSAVAGDTVYIKGGSYGGEHVVVANSGIPSAPIVFAGYDGTPDLNGQDWTGNGIYVYGKPYVTLKNIRVRNYRYGIYVDNGSHHFVAEGVVADSCTNTNITTSGWDGHGFLLQRSNGCEVKNCSATDNGGDNYILSKSDSCLFQNCAAYCTVAASDTFATDYYLVLAWSSHNVIRDCIAEDKAKSSKGNHGFIVKDNPGTSSSLKGAHSTNNKFINCTANCFEENFVAAHGCYNTLFDSCNGSNVGKAASYWDNIFMVRDSAYATTFSNCRAVASANVSGQVACLYDGVEGSGTTKYMQVQRQNNFINCTFEGGTRSVNFRNAETTTFENCTFVNSTYLFRFCKNYAGVDSCSGVVLKNCIISGVDSTHDVSVQGYPWTYSTSTTQAGYDDMADVTATCTDFWDGFGALSGTGNISADPLFADLAGGDLHLKSKAGRWDGDAWVQDMVSSPCIDAGDSASAYANEPEPNGARINMGRYGNTAEASKTYLNPVVYVTMSPDSTGDFVCDGTNDEAEINASLVFADTTGQYDTVYLVGPATYTIDTTLVVASGMTLTGDSTAVVKLAASAGWSAGCPMILTEKSGRDISIYGFEVDGNRANNSEAKNYAYTMCAIDSFSVNVHVYDMHLHENIGSGVSFVACDSIFVHDNTIYQAGYDGVAASHSTNVSIFDNIIEIRGWNGVSVYNSNHVKVYGNTITGYTGSVAEGTQGITVYKKYATNAMDDIEIFENSVSNIRYQGIRIYFLTGTTSYPAADAYVHLHHNTFTNCQSYAGSAAIGTYGFNVLVENNVADSCFTGGFAVEAGTDSSSGFTCIVQNNIFNSCTRNSGSAIANKRPKSETVIARNNCLFNNSTDYTADSSLTHTGDINANPLFADQPNRDYHLKSAGGRWDGAAWVTDSETSPCIDAGYATSDYSNEPEDNGGCINIGRYGNTAEASKSVPVAIAVDAPAVFSLSQNVPNPFNPSTTIAYTIPSACAVTMTVYNVAGQKVATLVREKQAAGAHIVRWQPENLASGIFFCRLEAGNYAKTMKLLYIK